MKRKQLIPLSVVSFVLALVMLLGSSLRASASVTPLRGYQQIFSVSLISDIATIRGAQPGYVVACAENNKLYFAKWYGSYPINPPYVIGGQDGIIWVDLVTAVAPITSAFLGSIPWSIVTGTPTTGSGYGITDLAPKSRNVTTSGALTVNGASSATLASDLAFGVSYGAPVSEVVGGSNNVGSATTVARSDHVHALPAFGSTSGTFAQGNDSRLYDDRTASGMRTATTVVSSSGATAPSSGMVYQASSSTAASWALIGNGNISANAIDPNKLTLGSMNYVFSSNGSTNAWSAITDAIHGSLSGGSDHAIAAFGVGTNGFVAATTTFNQVWMTRQGLGMGWGKVNNLQITDLDYSKLTSLPTLTTTLPLTGGGTLGALTLGVNSVSNTSSGVVPAVTGGYRVLASTLDGTGASWGMIAAPMIAPGGAGTLLSSNGSSVDWNTYGTLGINTGSGTANSIAKFTGTNTLGNSAIADVGNGYAVWVGAAYGVNTGYYGHAFTGAGQYKHITLGSSYFDGTNYITPNVGSNSVAELVTDTNGVGFVVLPSTGATTRNDTPANFYNWERFRVSSTGANVAGKFSIVGPYTTGNDVIPALGAGGTKFSLLNDGGTGAYGLLAGVLGNGNSFLQVQRVDGAATAYHLLLQPNGGAVGFGVTDPSAAVDTTTLRVRTGAADGYLWKSDANGLGSWNSIGSLGLLQNGASYYYVSDGLKLASTGAFDIYGGTLGYPTQATTGNGKDINIRAQGSTIGNGGNVTIYSGIGVTPSVDGVITLNSGTSGTGTINLVGNRIVGPSGIVFRKPQMLDAVTPTEDVQWTSLNSTGNTFVTIWFYGMDGLMTIDSGVYSFVWTVMARSVYFTTTAIYEATWTKSGGLTNNDSATIANPQGIALATGTSGGWVWLTAATPPGIGSSIVTRWDVKTQIIKH